MILALAGGPGCSSAQALPGEPLQTAGEDRQTFEAENVSDAAVVVHVCGAVICPGVYELAKGAHVADAVEAAGGFAPGAAESYPNLAAYVQDGEKIVIPYLSDVTEDCWGQEEQENAAGGLVNINTADLDLLMTLPGIGQVRAEAILAYRSAQGNFHAVEDIMKVSGIKEAAFEKIKDYITVGP